MAETAQRTVRFSSSGWVGFPMARPLTSVFSVALFLVVWEMAPRLGLIDVFYTSMPSRVLAAGLEQIASGELGEHVGISLVEFFWGFSMALGFGIPLGLMMGTMPNFRYLLDPVVTALYCLPRLAMLPVIIIWLGIGMESKVAIVLIGAVLPIVVNSMAGVREVDPVWIRAAQSFGAGRIAIFTKILLPGSLPAMLTGIRLGLGRGVLGVVIGEMYVSVSGIGHQIMSYGEAMRVDHLVFYALLVSLFGFVAVTLVGKLEERLQRWKGG